MLTEFDLFPTVIKPARNATNFSCPSDNPDRCGSDINNVYGYYNTALNNNFSNTKLLHKQSTQDKTSKMRSQRQSRNSR